jgi:hypothetical protein
MSTKNDKTEKIMNKMRQQKTKRILSEFLKINGENIIETTKKYTLENGPGALFITLVPNSNELDAEYFKIDDLDGNFKKKINDNPNKNTIYYAIRLHKASYMFERIIDNLLD